MSADRTYECPGCGRVMRREGLCVSCREKQVQEKMVAWTPEQVQEKLNGLIQHVERLKEDAWDKEFRALLSLHGVHSPELARAALEQEIYYPAELYYRAPEDVRDRLITALLETEDSRTASSLMSCLAMQGDGRSLEVLRELEEHPRPWREKLYADPSAYAWGGGWTFDRAGTRRQLNFDTCYPLIKGDRAKDKAARMFRPREDRCPHCQGKLVDVLVLDGRDERLKFLGLDGMITATCCPACVPWCEPAYSRFALDGSSTVVLPYEMGMDDEFDDEDDEDMERLADNPYVLGEKAVPVFYGAGFDENSTVGGFPFWVQDAQYYPCPDCGKTMKYLAQIKWENLDYMEGILYIELCPDCKVVSMHHQQT